MGVSKLSGGEKELAERLTCCAPLLDSSPLYTQADNTIAWQASQWILPVFLSRSSWKRLAGSIQERDPPTVSVLLWPRYSLIQMFLCPI